MSREVLRIATRSSPLAIWQAEYVQQRLESLHEGLSVELVRIKTQGDKILDTPLAKIGGKGLFVKELEEAIMDGRADIAVHSMKDVPMELPEGFALPVICEREDPRDAFVSNHHDSLSALPQGACVGTSSLRRQAQVQANRPDLVVKSLRGNVQTRLQPRDPRHRRAALDHGDRRQFERGHGFGAARGVVGNGLAAFPQVVGAPSRITEHRVLLGGTTGLRFDIRTEPAVGVLENTRQLLAQRSGACLHRGYPGEVLTFVELDLRQSGKIKALRLLHVNLLAASQDVESLGDPRRRSLARAFNAAAQVFLEARREACQSLLHPCKRRAQVRPGLRNLRARIESRAQESVGSAAVPRLHPAIALYDQTPDLARLDFQQAIDRRFGPCQIATHQMSLRERQRRRVGKLLERGDGGLAIAPGKRGTGFLSQGLRLIRGQCHVG